MAEDRRTDRACGKADGVDRERLQRARQRIGLGEIQLGEDERRPLAVEEEIVPFDRRADRAGDHGAPQLGAMVEVEKRVTATSATVIGDPPLQPAFDVLTTSFLHRFPILKSSFDRTKIARIAIIRMLLDGGPCSCNSAASSRAYCVFCENFISASANSDEKPKCRNLHS